MSRVSALLLAVAAAGCTDAPDPEDGELAIHIMPARDDGPHPDIAAPMTYHGGLIVHAPQVVDVRYGAGTYLPENAGTGPGTLDGFYTQLVSSGIYNWLDEYDAMSPLQAVAPGALVATVPITPAASRNGSTITGQQVNDEIAAQITAGTLPSPNDSTIYMVHFPAGKTIDAGANMCSATNNLCAYHGNFALAGKNVFIGVIPDMTSPACQTYCSLGLSPFGVETYLTTHELYETVFTPVQAPPTSPTGWFEAGGAQIADKCENGPNPVGQILGTDGRIYAVATLFSNQQNALGVNPCVTTETVDATGASETWSATPFVGRIGNFFADVDGDGKADAIIVDPTTNVRVRLSTGTAFATQVQGWTTGAFFGGAGTFFADVNGDGKADAIALDAGDIVVRLSTGSAFAAPQTWSTTPFAGSVSTAFADVNGDGMADAIQVNSSNIVVRLSTGSSFGRATLWASTGFVGSAGTFFADVDGDHKADAIAVTASTILVRSSTGVAFAGTRTWLSDPHAPGGVATLFADVDGDGKADAIAVNTNDIVVHRSAVGSAGAQFGFAELWTVAPFVGNSANAFADVTGDHKADAIAVSSTGIAVRRSLRSSAP